MMDEEERTRLANQAELDRSVAGLVDLFPRSWFGLYAGCKQQGFSDVQAMQCVIAYISASCSPRGD